MAEKRKTAKSKLVSGGLFITFEGPDGAGKTTQITLLENHLKKKGYKVLSTREPGGTVISEAVRAILLNPDFGEMDPRTEALLYAAARAQHVAEVIQPALVAGKIVLCDRYIDSTYAYQGYGRGLEMDFLRKVNEAAMNGVMPGLTVILDLPAGSGQGRVRERAENGGPGKDRLERESRDFHARVREGFLKLAGEEPGRCHILNGRLGIEDLHGQIKDLVMERLG